MIYTNKDGSTVAGPCTKRDALDKFSIALFTKLAKIDAKLDTKQDRL